MIFAGATSQESRDKTKRSGPSLSRRRQSAATLVRVLLVIAGLTILAGCGGSSSSPTPTPSSPAITLSPTSLTFSSAVGTTSAAQSVTVTDSGTAALTFSSFTPSSSVFSQTNNCGTGIVAGGTCTINVTFTPTASGTVSGTLSITDNASGSPQTVTLTGTGVVATVSVSPSSLTFSSQTQGTPSASQPVTLTNNGNAALAITSVAVTGDFSQTNNCGTNVSAGGSCTINVTFTPTAAGTRIGTLTITDNASGSPQTVSLTGTGAAATGSSNTAQVTVSFGPNGNTGNSASNYYNGIFTTVTVCTPGTTNCVAIPDILVDTGSVGLRILSDQLGSVALTPISDGTGYTLYECVQYGDLSYNWGPMAMATVQIGGEAASQIPASAGGTANSGIPIQVITVGGTAPSGASCASGGGGSDNTVSILGARGILGVGNYADDCGSYCGSTPSSYTSPPWPYIACNSTSCSYATVSDAAQAWNPVAAFSGTDTNGVMLQLPSIPVAGQATATGTLTFGIGTQTNNAIPGSATIYGLDQYGDFASTVYNGVTYTSAGFLDSGSNALYVLDYTTLTSATGVSTVDCKDNAYYCPASTLTLNITNTGSNGTSGAITLSLANADSLFSTNATYAAFSNLGSDSGTSPATDYFDYGLPFFFGRTVFVGIEGTTAGSTTFTNGFWAF